MAVMIAVVDIVGEDDTTVVVMMMIVVDAGGRRIRVAGTFQNRWTLGFCLRFFCQKSINAK